MNTVEQNTRAGTIAVILQARMGSQRLPGKVLRDIAGRPMLEWCVLRIRESRLCPRLIVATSTAAADDAIARFCDEQRIPVFRGSEKDVLSRYYEAARQLAVDPVIRLTADCPLIDPQVLDTMIAAYFGHQADYLSNTIERTFPQGLDAEIFSFAALRTAHALATQAYEHEHVTPFIYQHPERFTIAQHKNTVDLSQWRLTVDTEDDLRVIEAIYTHFCSLGVAQKFTLAALHDFLTAHPELREINRHVHQKQLGE